MTRKNINIRSTSWLELGDCFDITARTENRRSIDVNCGQTALAITGKKTPLPLPFAPEEMMEYAAEFDGSDVIHGGSCP